MNTIAQIDWRLLLYFFGYRKGKTILVYALLLRRFDFKITWNFVLMNYYMTVGIKEKERSTGKISFYCLGSIIQKI